MNAAWWELRLRYQGIIPPVSRTESHFDPAAKRHIPADIPYMRYYVALLLEFQIHNSTCFASGHYGTLHTCDIYRSREAGRVISYVIKSQVYVKQWGFKILKGHSHSLCKFLV